MATTVRFYWHVSGETDGQKFAIDDWRNTPVKEITAPGDRLIHKILTVPASGQATLWDHLDAKDWAFIIVQPVGETGEFDLGLIYDTVDANGVPTGSVQRARGQRVSCNSPAILNDPDAKVHGTIGTDAAVSAGYPARDTDGSSVAGKAVKGTAYNTGATAFQVNVWIVGGIA